MYHKRKNNKDLVSVLSNLRDADRQELEMLYGVGWYEHILKNWLKMNGVRIGYLEDGTPVMVCGVMKVGDIGSIGMLATRDVEKELRSFLILGRRWVDLQLKKYKKLANYVYSENTKAIKWLEWLGFDVEKHSGIGSKFLRFERVSRSEA